MKNLILNIFMISWALFWATSAMGEEVEVSSLEELAEYAARDDNQVRMVPGEYVLDSDEYAGESGRNHLLRFSGSGNVFDFNNVTIKINTKVHNKIGDIYEVILTGNNNTIEGLALVHTGAGDIGPSGGGRTFSVFGDGNIIRNVRVETKGSWPYGYGDLLGKGGNKVTSTLKKHSSFLIRGAANTRVVACTVINRALGHSFFIQGESPNTLLKNCYAEGEIRTTDEMLAETSGPAYKNDFRSVYLNREEEKKIAPGYMKSLNECGFRTYASQKNLRILNCRAKHQRVGFAIAMDGDYRPEVKGSVAKGCERGFYVNNAVIEDCRGDAKYGPLLYMRGGSDSEIDLALMDAESEMKVHTIATICGEGHHIVLSARKDRRRDRETPVLMGYEMPPSGENASPIPEADARDITLISKTGMPVKLGSRTSNCRVETDGKLLSDEGKNNKVHKIGN